MNETDPVLIQNKLLQKTQVNIPLKTKAAYIINPLLKFSLMTTNSHSLFSGFPNENSHYKKANEEECEILTESSQIDMTKVLSSLIICVCMSSALPRN